MKGSSRSQGGFTLLEVILWLAISATLLSAAVLLFVQIQSVFIKSQVVSEVEGQGIQAMQIVIQTIQDSVEVVTPTLGNDSASISLNLDNGSLDTTDISIDGDGSLQIIESGGTPIQLTNGRVIVSNLLFSNFSSSTEYSSIRVEFDLSHVNLSNRNEFSYTRNFRSAASFFNQ